MYFKLTILFGMLALCNVASSLECHKKHDGSFEFLEDGNVVDPEPFYCLSFTKPEQTTTLVTYLNDDEDGDKVCQINEDGMPKVKTVFTASTDQTATRCRYACKDSTGLYKCDAPTGPADNACTCHQAPHRLLILPIHEIGGQSDRTEGMSCEGKEEGYQFDDPVPCSSIQADVRKLRVNRLAADQVKCRAEISTKQETRYTEGTEGAMTIQGCFFVCKQAGPRCIGEVEDGECDCESPGLTKRLVPMDIPTVRDVLKQTSCLSGGCGPCGTCNAITSQCELVANAHEGDYCGCGEICPNEDLRAPEHRGGQILCRPNVGLDCMKKPGWLTSLFDYAKPGTRYPNLCRTGEVDATDTCSCAPGHIEQPGPFSGIYCVRR